ncbi:HtaA domain-containing protein [Microbacterium caowuchunii]|uniref:HtaA domain-containing protein n=1 Tax=Microbacterium caowuchunii TaxID=2614638 RepID=UPI00177B3D54|nr:HtaA domain-containing protein [Microbacterium caowuchunii]
MQKTRRASLRRVLASVLTGALIASGAALGVAIPASAADGGTATLSWGVRDSWRNYISSPIAAGTITSSSPTTIGADGVANWSSGSGTLSENRTGSVSFSGNARYLGHQGALDLTTSNARVEITSATSATVYFDVTSAPYNNFPATNVTGMPFATFTLSAPSINGDVATWTTGRGVLTAQALAVFGGLYNADPYADPMTFSAPFTIPVTATSTTLTASPSGTATAGDPVQLTAAVTPAVDGSMEFFDGTTSLGTAAVVNGSAQLSTSALAVGSHQLSATFTPSAATYSPSSAAALAYVITAVPAPDADSTETVLTVSPATRAPKGESVTLDASVTNSEGAEAPVGSVRFFSIAAGGAERTLLGETPVANGSAAFTSTNLAAGGHSFVAEFVPATSAFEGSASAASGNYGIVDLAVPAACTPGPGSATSGTEASATWKFSEYSYAGYNQWKKTATGDIGVSGSDFVFSGGEVTADAHCASIVFDGSFKIEPHAGVWMEFTNPVLRVTAAGAGVWTADVTTSSNATAQNLPIGAFSGATGFGPGNVFDGSVTFAYAGTVAQGTWNKDYANAWPNALIWNTPASIQAYFYQSGPSAANLQKPASPLNLEFEWPATTETTLAVAPATRTELGNSVTLTASVVPAQAQGTVEFFGTSVVTGTTISLGSADVIDGAATFSTATLPAGGHGLEAVFTSSNGYDGSTGTYETTSRGTTTPAYYGIVDPAVQTVAAPTTGERVSNVSATWGWSAYSDDWTKIVSGNVTLDGEDFVLTGGTGIVTADAAVIDFTGTMRVEAYATFFPANGQWIELVDPMLTIADGRGTWTAGVRSGIGDYTPSPTEELVIATIAAADVPDFSAASVDESLTFDYAGTTAAGTWATSASGVGFTDAWTNEFVLALPAEIKSFYYASGAGGDVRKSPAALKVAWTEPTPAATVLNGHASVVQGGVLQISGSGFRDKTSVTAVIHSDPITIGTQVADASGSVSYRWNVPTDFAVGAHTVTLSVDGAVVASVPVTVVAAGTPSPVAPEAPQVASCVAHAVSGASIQWGVKQSFVAYVEGPIASGTKSINWGSGSGAYSTDTNRGRVSYGGSAYFEGHGGLLQVSLSNPRIQINSATSATLILNVNATKPDGTPAVNANGVAFASLSLPTANRTADRISWSGASATLTSAGAAAFAGFYDAGAALDPVSFSFPLGAEVECDSTTDGNLAATGAESSADVLWIGAGLFGLGLLLVVMRRRRANA